MAEFTTVADGVRAQVVRHTSLPPHLDSTAHEGQGARCPCVPLLNQLVIRQRAIVRPQGTRQACVDGDHQLEPLYVARWATAPLELSLQAHQGAVDLTLTMCAYCGAVEVRDVSFHAPAGLRLGSLAPRRRSDVLGWYSGKRAAGRIYR